MQQVNVQTNKKRGFTLLEVAIAIIAIALIAGVIVVSKKLVSNAGDLVALNQADNNWQAVTETDIEEETEETLPVTSGLVLWLDAADSDTITSSSNKVSGWADKAGSNNLSQNNSDYQPSTAADTINNLNTLSFDATNDHLSLGNALIGSTENFTIFAVANLDVVGSNRFIVSQYSNFGHSNRTVFLILNQANNNISYFRGDPGFVNSGQVVSAGVAALFMSARNGNNLTIEKNGTGNSSNVSSFTVAQLPFTIGTGSSVQGVLQGHVGEIIVYNRALTDEERGEVETYLNNKWALY